MVDEHFPAIDAEYCLAEGGSVTRSRRAGEVRVGADAREDSARDRADGARAGRSRLGPASEQRHRAPGSARSARSRRGRRRSGSTTRRAPTSSGWRRSRRRTRRSGTARSSAPTPRRATAADEYFLEARAAARVDAAHVRLAEHHPGRLSHQRDPVRGQGDARRAHASRTTTAALPRAGAQGRQRSGGRGAVGAARRAARQRQRAPRLRGVQGASRRRSRSTTRR